MDVQGSMVPRRSDGSVDDEVASNTSKDDQREAWRQIEGGPTVPSTSTLCGTLKKRHAAEKSLTMQWGKRYFFVDDKRGLLQYSKNAKQIMTKPSMMIPLADIVAVEVETPLKDIVAIIAEQGHTRLPVYRGTLDDAIGMAHIKDLFLWEGREQDFKLAEHLRRILFVAPSMEVLELLLEMRARRSHMALVVDEYGGVDGLATIEDLVEEIVGEIEDEHDEAVQPKITVNDDGTILAEARLEVEALEILTGRLLEDDDRDEIDTVGGLVCAVAGRVPGRGEVVRHPTGVQFEVIEGDPRRLSLLKVRGAPRQAQRPLSEDPGLAPPREGPEGAVAAEGGLLDPSGPSRLPPLLQGDVPATIAATKG